MEVPSVSGPTALVFAVAVTAMEAFIIFPWWFGVIHLFAVYDKEHIHGSYLIYPSTTSDIAYRTNHIQTVLYTKV